MSNAQDPVTVGIAVVRHDDRLLVGVRNSDAPLGGLAEFPGGKCRPDESVVDCVRRECFEETGLQVLPRQLLLERLFKYSHATVHLHFWQCDPDATSSAVKPHGSFRWVPIDRLVTMSFPEANQPLIELLTAQAATDAD